MEERSRPLLVMVVVSFRILQLLTIPITLPLMLKIMIKVNQKYGEAPIIEADITP